MDVHVKGQGSLRLTKSNFVASGGEGSVYAIGDTAVKIYSDPSKMIPLGKIQELQGITDKNVIKPERPVLDAKGKPLGYTMRYVRDTVALCQLFPRAYRDRMGITPNMILDLVQRMQAQVEDIHKAGVLVVDLNEMNFLVSADHADIFAIDVDSYQTAHYPATAIMPSVRDWHTPLGDFTELSDWFSFATVAFQLFIGVHPYKGKHPSVKGFEDRMKANLSVFNTDVRMPRVCYPLDVIPDVYRQWFKAVLEDGKRLPPPAGLHATIIVAPTVKTMKGTANLDIRDILDLDAPQLVAFGTSGPNMCVVTPSGIWLDRRRVGDAPTTRTTIGFTPIQNKAIVASLTSDGNLRLWSASDRQEVPVTTRASDLMACDGRVYIQSNDKILEVVLRDVGNRVIASTRLAANVLPQATRLFQGVAVQDLLGSCYVSLFPASGRTQQVHLTELDGWTIVDAKYAHGVLMIEAAEKGQTRYDRFVFRFDERFESYDFRKTADVMLSGLNFVTLDSGVCIHLTDEEKLELCANRKGSAQVKVVEDPVLGGDMLLLKDSGRLLFHRGAKIYSMRMT